MYLQTHIVASRQRLAAASRSVLALSLLAACSPIDSGLEAECPGPDCPGCPGPSCGIDPEGKADTTDYNELNSAAGTMVLYEVQVRSANACHPQVGADWQRQACSQKVAPTIPYRAEGMGCGDADALEQIRLGTLDDMLESSADYRQGITLRYIDERVGANTVWLMPLFPNNDTWNIPDACDNLGSPYAVRDYLHARGTLARSCILAGRDEYSETPCWGNDELDALIAQAHQRGLKVMLDVALNHFGHNYLMYDYATFTPVRQRIAEGQDLDRLWDYVATDDEALLHPAVLDRADTLLALADAEPARRADLDALLDRCPDLTGDRLVRGYNIWRVALDWERAQFECEPLLERAAPGFYLGGNHWDPSTGLGDNFSNNWRDVKFLYHHEENYGHRHEFVRDREYLFRILNYWVSRGVDGFRLDHTTDFDGGMGPNEWDYIISKLDYYAWRRGQARPVFLAEEFHDQMGMSKVVDVMTDGYLGNLAGRNGITKDAGHVEQVVANNDRFGGHTYVMSTLETHDEHRLLDGTGFDIWTGAGFWAVGAATWSTPMLLMGQEFGEPWGLGFRKSDFLRGRFEGTWNYNGQGDALVGYYHQIITNRLAPASRALLAAPRHFLRTTSNTVDPRIFAQAKWSGDGNVVFTFFNLWPQNVAQSYYLPPDIAAQMWIRDDYSYRLYDLISQRPLGPCHLGADLKWSFYVAMDAATRLQWLRLEKCD